MVRELREIEWSGTPGEPIYLRFSKMPVAKTEVYANGEVTVDLDHVNDVIGIELLSAEPDELAALARVGQEHDLRFDLFFSSATKRGAI